MGNDESRQESSDSKSTDPYSDFVLIESNRSVDSLPRIDPLRSRAVCAGVGRHVNKRLRESDNPTCDADVRLLARAIERVAILPSENVEILDTESPYTATACNIEDALRNAAENVETDGALFFCFSGHGTHYGNRRVALVGADFVDRSSPLITAKKVIGALAGLKSIETPVVVILDCCFAAGIAREVASLIEDDKHKIYFLAACSASEKTIGTKQLGSGVFTFFLADYLMKLELGARFPLRAAIKHCYPLCDAIGGLLIRTDAPGVDSTMQPTLVSTELVLEFLDGRYRVRERGEDAETDGGAPTRRKFSQTLDYLSYEDAAQFEVDLKWSEDVAKWLAHTVEPKLIVLKVSGHLAMTNVYKTVTCLMMQSMGVLAGKRRPDLAGNPATFFLSFYRMVESLNEVMGESMPQESDELSLSLAYYIPGVARVTGKNLKDFTKLLQLFSRLRRDESEEDEPDGMNENAISVIGEIAKTPQPIENLE